MSSSSEDRKDTINKIIIIANGKQFEFRNVVLDTGCDSGIAVSPATFSKMFGEVGLFMSFHEGSNVEKMGLCSVNIPSLDISGASSNIVAANHFEEDDIVIGRFLLLDFMNLIRVNSFRPFQLASNSIIYELEPGKVLCLLCSPNNQWLSEFSNSEQGDQLRTRIMAQQDVAIGLFRNKNYELAAEAFIFCYLMGKFVHSEDSVFLGTCCYNAACCLNKSNDQFDRARFFCSLAIDYSHPKAKELLLTIGDNEILL
ncbi:predicted protein [Naegleria gruberi]|uniref:Predicted protein n=1 Tax=Naegleria gruberi TaxID=5762 RepID=D2VN28_NAEGR|nr:uncharacterized protein NAEGRDRAFT_70350 [Naegleria gruberi]EFC41922.1 predicted protein [Naegleria gruberi]|eukprot:XP_002674666.1 predicted protein [Naegleria gruberi strain NEG-M]